MDSEFPWINACFVMDESGNLITMSYVDLRAQDQDGHPYRGKWLSARTRTGGDRGDSRVASRTILAGGENLIRDEHEGLASEWTEAVDPETPAEAVDRRRDADMNEAIEPLDSGVTRKSRAVKRSGKHVRLGEEWRIFSTRLMPDSEDVWAARRASLETAHDHESAVWWPARFAQAYGWMVAEQPSPRGKDADLRESFGEEQSVQSRHPSQLILHRPVVHADRLHDEPIRDGKRTSCPQIAGVLATKSARIER